MRIVIACVSLLFSLGACADGVSAPAGVPKAPRAVAEKNEAHEPKVAVGGPEDEKRDAGRLAECKEDSDCTLTCYRPDACCPDPCWCDNPVAKSGEQELRRTAESKCNNAPRGCPPADCGQRAYRMVPYCSAGRCAARSEPPGYGVDTSPPKALRAPVKAD
jgi:hypothetical protein